MTWLTAPKTRTGIAHAMMMLLLTEIATLFGLFLYTVFGYMTFFITPETLYDILLTLIIWLTVLKISGGSFSLCRGLFPLFLFPLFFLCSHVRWIVARDTTIHNPFQIRLLQLCLLDLFYLNVFDFRVDSTLNVRLAYILDTLLAFNFVWKERSVAICSFGVLVLSSLDHQQCIRVVNGLWGLVNNLICNFSGLCCR